ncbi:hypothetical protein MUG87_14680 [Ectobacillus sp. JY-23]|uniref:hypothetical protein n=1 Tax=Ectobacillus sp. JY-23 TaxID=2933872 RepID=UPI001FF444F2|nr:hypothetical protein [Ectobacillus sp. JY-23]UOY91728.1 hypothetical protein MUG87_14680 [Ectobacillus sp. JY-23]
MSNHTGVLKDKFEAALEKLEQAKLFAKSMYQTEIFQLAIELAGSDDGLAIIYKNAHRFEKAGVFYGGPWEDPTKMQPSLVGGSLKLKAGANSIIELLSEMRMLAIAKGDCIHEVLKAHEAEAFLNEVLALNLDLLPPKNEENCTQLEDHILRAQRLFRYLGQELSFREIAEKIVQEIDRLTVQRPIMVGRILNMISLSEQLVKNGIGDKTAKALEKYSRAANGPTQLSKKASNQRSYGLMLETAYDEERAAESNSEETKKKGRKKSASKLGTEAKLFADAMKDTGLVSPYHAVLLRFLNRRNPDLIPAALGLSEAGTASFHANKELIHHIIQLAIFPETRQAIYGLSRTLDRGVLAEDAVAPAILRLFELPLHAQVKQTLLKNEYKQSGISPNGVLVAGVMSVLGQPLGVGQGLNPTCQSARAISLWAQYGIGQLLAYIAHAAQHNDLEMTFEGETIRSFLLSGGGAEEIHPDLDPVSSVLVPHLDKIYFEMIKRTLLFAEDGHKWINPEFYGKWIPNGFINAIDPFTLNVTNYRTFVRLFYATHHPDYNEGYKLIYPNPIGIFTTDVHGNLLGLHAVSIQRIKKDQNGDCRIYFYNPNNDSGQNWGQNIKPSVSGFGELEGESSLLFHELLARMYAFHYNPYQQGDTYMVEDSLVENVEALAKDSWGKNYVWEEEEVPVLA